MTYKEAAKALVVWRGHLKKCRTCSHGIGYTCTRCFYGEDLEKEAEVATKFVNKRRR